MKTPLTSRPNILLLTADQQRYDTIGAVNAPFMITPNLDRMAREGCVFRRAHSPNPVCVSARHNILTGLPARYHGMPHNGHHPLPPTLPTLPRLLSEAGYRTGAIGKMHFYPVRAHHGFDSMRLMEEIPTHVEDDEYVQYLRSVGLGDLLQIHGSRVLGYQLPQRSIMPEQHHGSTWVARETCRFMEANQDRPWFAWASWVAPHPPANVPDTFADLYAGAALPAVRGLAGAEKPEARRFRELYYAAISLVDKGVGMVLDKLDELGLAENTLVIYASDHGEMLGDLGLLQKQLPYEGSVRVPLMVRFPNRVPGGLCQDEFADLNDILPTALDAAGINVEAVAKQHGLKHGFPGSSLLRLKEGRDRSVQYAEFGDLEEPMAGRWVMLRDERWKYIHWYGRGGVDVLFDMANDPDELYDLAGNPSDAIQSERRRLRTLALQYEERWGLHGTVRDNDFASIPACTDMNAYRTPTPEWSLAQWPVFPGRYASAHLKQLEEEFGIVVEKEPLGADTRAELGGKSRAEWWKQWNKHGGSRAVFMRLFGCQPPDQPSPTETPVSRSSKSMACSSVD